MPAANSLLGKEKRAQPNPDPVSVGDPLLWKTPGPGWGLDLLEKTSLGGC